MTEPKFPWALLVILGMFGFIAFSSKPLWLQVGGGIGSALVAAAAVYQIIPRKDESLRYEKKKDDDVLDEWPDRDPPPS